MEGRGSSSAAAAAASDETDPGTVANDYVPVRSGDEAGAMVQGHLSHSQPSHPVPCPLYPVALGGMPLA